MDWGYTIKIWGLYHTTHKFNEIIFGHPLSRITLFWGHFKTLNFPLEDILQLFPGLALSQVFLIKLNYWKLLIKVNFETVCLNNIAIWLDLKSVDSMSISVKLPYFSFFNPNLLDKSIWILIQTVFSCT